MKLDSKKSKAAVKNSAVKQKKVKAKATNPAKAPKVKKLSTQKKLKRLIQTKGQGKEKVKYKIDTYSCFRCRLCKCYFKWFIS